MRSFAVITIILLAVILVSTSWMPKLQEQPDDIDNFEKAMSGMAAVLPPDQPFSLHLISVGSEYVCFARYFLVPRRLYPPEINSDTVLIISDQAHKDSVANYVANGKKVLWRNEDEQRIYLLACSR